MGSNMISAQTFFMTLTSCSPRRGRKSHQCTVFPYGSGLPVIGTLHAVIESTSSYYSMHHHLQRLTCIRRATASNGKDMVEPKTQDAMPAAAATPTPAFSFLAARRYALVRRSKHPTMQAAYCQDEHCVGLTAGQQDAWAEAQM